MQKQTPRAMVKWLGAPPRSACGGQKKTFPPQGGTEKIVILDFSLRMLRCIFCASFDEFGATNQTGAGTYQPTYTRTDIASHGEG